LPPGQSLASEPPENSGSFTTTGSSLGAAANIAAASALSEASSSLSFWKANSRSSSLKVMSVSEMPAAAIQLDGNAVLPGFGLPRQQGRQDSNLQPPVLETGALPVELRPSAVRGTDCIGGPATL